MPAYWHGHGKVALLRSTDGVNWELCAPIYEGDRIDETAVEFLADGRMPATGRLEASDTWTGHRDGATLVTVALSPYDKWAQSARSAVTRIDLPSLKELGETLTR